MDLHLFSIRRLVRSECEHLRIDHRGLVARLDIPGSTVLPGKVSLCFEIDHDARLFEQLDSVRAFADLVSGRPPLRCARSALEEGLLALWTLDARENGISLRDTADLLFGPGDWPGEGEHRKSRIRRLLAKGQGMVQAGARGILSNFD